MRQLATWHRTRWGRLTFAVIELAVAYVFASLAIDSGSLLQYAVAALALIGSLQNFVKFLWNLVHDDKTAKA